MMQGSTSKPNEPAINPALLFVLCCAWIAVSLAGARLAALLVPAHWYDLARTGAAALLMFGGFYLMARQGISDLRPLSSVGFVRRPGTVREFGVGTALGWGIGLLLVLPGLLSHNTILQFRWDTSAVLQGMAGLAVLCVFALAVQMVLAGLPVRLLVRSVGPGWSVTAVIFVGALLAVLGSAGEGRSLLYTALALCLPVVAFLRTRAIWLPLGLQIGLTASVQLLFGAPSPYTPPTSGVVQSYTSGPAWLTGGAYGPEASAFAILILLVALPVLFRVTKDYAWHYAYQPITAGGYPVEVAPPAEHVRQTQQVPVASSLVQIGGVPLTASSKEARAPDFS